MKGMKIMVAGKVRSGRGSPAVRSTHPFLPKSMSDASTVATAKDIPNNVLATGQKYPPPTIPALNGTLTTPQNVVPTEQHSFIGSIIGDKCALPQNFWPTTKPLTRTNLEPVV